MNHTEARNLIRAGVTTPGGTWADLGAGSGVFTRALADLVGPAGTVYAVDRQQGRAPDGAPPGWADVIQIRADFAGPLELPPLDGLLMANALHFVRRPARVLTPLVAHLRPGGTFLLVEYDLTRGSPWIPFPVPLERFRALAPGVGLEGAHELARRPSRYGPREIYAAIATKE